VHAPRAEEQRSWVLADCSWPHFGIAGHPLDHHDKHHPAFIPTAQPTHSPAVDLIPQPRFSEKSQVLRFYAHNSHDIHGSQTPESQYDHCGEFVLAWLEISVAARHNWHRAMGRCTAKGLPSDSAQGQTV
jgi:hypothetical protein